MRTIGAHRSCRASIPAQNNAFLAGRAITSVLSQDDRGPRHPEFMTIWDDIKDLALAQERDRKKLAENLSLILSNRKRILRDAPLAQTTTPAAYVSMAVLAGSGRLPMGAVLSLWEKGLFLTLCPKCGGKVYLFSLGGSPLSGANHWWGVCSACREAREGSYARGEGGMNLATRLLKIVGEKERWCPFDPDDPIARESGLEIGETTVHFRVSAAEELIAYKAHRSDLSGQFFSGLALDRFLARLRMD